MMFLISCGNVNDKNDDVTPTNEPSVDNEIQKDIFQAIKILGSEGHFEARDKKTGIPMAKVTYPYFALNQDDAKKYPQLQEALLNWSEAIKESQFEAFERIKKALNDSQKEPLENIKQATIRRADSKVVSILLYSVSEFSYWGENYDSKTGNKLALSDVVNQKDNLANMILEQLEKFYWEMEFLPSMDLGKLIQEEKEISWTIDYNGITFYFNPYVIAASVTEPQIVTLSFEEYPELIKPEYSKGFSSYSMEVENNTVFYCDVTGDDMVDAINCSVFKGGISISLNNEIHYREDAEFESAKIAMTYADGGECMLFVELYKDHSRCETVFYNLSKNVGKVGTIKKSLYHMKYQTGELWKQYDVFTKPEAYRW